MRGAKTGGWTASRWRRSTPAATTGRGIRRRPAWQRERKSAGHGCSGSSQLTTWRPRRRNTDGLDWRGQRRGVVRALCRLAISRYAPALHVLCPAPRIATQAGAGLNEGPHGRNRMLRKLVILFAAALMALVAASLAPGSCRWRPSSGFRYGSPADPVWTYFWPAKQWASDTGNTVKTCSTMATSPRSRKQWYRRSPPCRRHRHHQSRPRQPVAPVAEAQAVGHSGSSI